MNLLLTFALIILGIGAFWWMSFGYDGMIREAYRTMRHMVIETLLVGNRLKILRSKLRLWIIQKHIAYGNVRAAMMEKDEPDFRLILRGYQLMMPLALFGLIFYLFGVLPIEVPEDFEPDVVDLESDSIE